MLNDFGAILKEFRHSSGITQRELADAVSVDPTTISQYENGRRSFPMELLEPACACMNITVWDFLKEVFPQDA